MFREINRYFPFTGVMRFCAGRFRIAAGRVVLVAHWILPPTIPLLLIVLICLSDLIGARITDIAAQCFQAMEQLGYTANFSLLPYLLRMISAAILFALWHRASAMTWGWFYLGSTIVSCAIAVAVTNWKLGPPQLAFRVSRRS